MICKYWDGIMHVDVGGKRKWQENLFLQGDCQEGDWPGIIREDIYCVR